MLEMVDPKPPGLEERIRSRLAAVEEAVQQFCNKTLLTGLKALRAGSKWDARRAYEEGLAWFPDDEHPCRDRLLGALRELESPVSP